MAGWRDRGYVADSDEEEESQNKSSIDQELPQEIDPHIGNTEGNPASQQAGAGSRSSENKNEDGAQAGESDHLRSEQDGARLRNWALSSAPGLGESDTDPSAGGNGASSKTDGEQFSDEDVDELQQDHYVTTQSEQPQEEMDLEQRHTSNLPQSNHQTSSGATSPLSSVSSTSSLASQRVATGKSFLTQVRIEAPPVGSQPLIPMPPLPTAPLLDGVNQVTPAARSLRQRNPIQLHPYLVEGEKYRQILKARGLRPIRQEAETPCALETETQNAESFEEDSQPTYDAQPFRPPSPLQSQESSPNALGNDDALMFGEGDLPDMDEIFERPLRKYIGNRHKRRKTASTTFEIPRTFQSPKQDLVNRDGASIPSNETSVFDVPPSPPHSGSQTPPGLTSLARPKFRVPKGLMATALPTPITSSEPRRQPVLEYSDDDDSARIALGRTHFSRASDDSDDELSLSEDESSHQLRRVQRRIKGVLPASWLKLDLKTQKKKPEQSNKNSARLSPEKDSTQRGVARRIFSVRSTSKDLGDMRKGPIYISDDDGSDSSGNVGQQVEPQHRQLSVPDNDDQTMMGRLGEAAEDDQVDAMLPAAPRQRAQHKKRKKRQLRPADFASNSCTMHAMTFNRSKHNKLVQLRITDRFDKGHKRKPVFRLPRLSILDAPLKAQSSSAAVPAFLKIATRATRLRNDKGRHSPSRKYLRLATKEDDDDANETLRDWRAGTIAPLFRSMTDATATRQPLRPHSGNAPRPSSSSRLPEAVNEAGKTSLITDRPFPSFRTRKPRSLQTSLDHLVEQQVAGNGEIARIPAPDATRQAEIRSKKRGQLVSSIRASHYARPAMLETFQETQNELQARNLFRQDLTHINSLEDGIRLPKVLRMFGDEHRLRLENPKLAADRFENEGITRDLGRPGRQVAPHKSRKRKPRRLEVTKSWSRPSTELVMLDDFTEIASPVLSCEAIHGEILLGLGPFGTRYTADFDATPLPTGTYFHHSTILGSGLFSCSLQVARRMVLDSPRGFAVWTDEGATLRWGPWNDTVSSELGNAFKSVSQAFRGINEPQAAFLERALSILKNIVSYLTNHLSFLDPMDRPSFAQRLKALLTMILSELAEQKKSGDTSTKHPTQERHAAFKARVLTLTLIVTNQLRQISEHEMVSLQLQAEVNTLLQTAIQQILSVAVPIHFDDYEKCLISLKSLKSTSCDSYIIDQQPTIEALVVALHVFAQQPERAPNLLKVIQNDVPTKNADGSTDTRSLEQVWKKVFTLLPFLELDSLGVLETGRRFRSPHDNWMLVKRLAIPVLDASLQNPRGQSPSFNSYCRAVFSRCLHLINDWGWYHCESIIGTLFDFFARKNLAHLQNEGSHGSPSFLEKLDRNPSLAAKSEDRCFHLLLKIIASGIRHMRQHYPEKRIRDLAWRLMPNHGRFHPKEEAIRQEDLDALRNHHDLLCTLFWASPASCRPRLAVIRNLVNLESSHRETCHINIRAWFNLIKFQLSTEEPVSSLIPFAEWYEDLLQQILRQHANARTEVETQVRSVQHTNNFAIPNDLFESTIARNQRQVEAILSDALVCLSMAVHSARNEISAGILMTVCLTKVFDLFDAKKPQANTTIAQALDVLLAYSEKVLGAPISKPRNGNEDSQEYGDWSAFDEDNVTAIPPDGTTFSLLILLEPLRHLLSNCFGADLVPEDSILLKLVETWTAVAQVLVRTGERSWSDYLDRFGNNSWSSLRDTEQTRKFTPFYLAALIEREWTIFADHQQPLLAQWMVSLVERESLLKFQHRLMGALLNNSAKSPLLHNLPFSSDSETGAYQITATDFSERRLTLISSVLSNMRVSLEHAVFDPAVNSAQRRQDYKDLLKYLMAAMKYNYQELGHGTNVNGAYVDFVHRVVELLQQHTSTICPIDRFFTDEGGFPLPAADPTYVVGHLKSYALRLLDPKTLKQLAVFLQSVSERAAVDGQQSYLVSQLQTAMSSAFEDEKMGRPTLRSFIIQTIVPAYTSLAFTTDSGWILALPYLRALQQAFAEMLMDLDGTNANSVNTMSAVITAFLSAVQRSMGILTFPSQLLEQPRALKTLTGYYEATTALLRILDYLSRLSGPTQGAVECLQFMRAFATFARARVLGDQNAFAPDVRDHEDTGYAETRNFATQELRDTLTKNWVCHEERYYIVRSASRREVAVNIGLFEEERRDLLTAFEDFFDRLERMPALGSGRNRQLMRRRTGITGMKEIFL
ncbi:hypothetical protein MMC21_002482 [Puttea exsequens]|nr:hypothetical protein [Puttea exsequens]